VFVFKGTWALEGRGEEQVAGVCTAYQFQSHSNKFVVKPLQAFLCYIS
jgi:hypothetical protein